MQLKDFGLMHLFREILTATGKALAIFGGYFTGSQ
jgi:hypothetical protein